MTNLLKCVVRKREIYQLLYEREWQPSLKEKFRLRVQQCDRLKWRLATRRLRRLGWTP